MQYDEVGGGEWEDEVSDGEDSQVVRMNEEVVRLLDEVAAEIDP